MSGHAVRTVVYLIAIAILQLSREPIPLVPFAASAMNVAGTSQPRFGRPAANGRALNASEYEDDLLQLLLDLGPLGAQHLRQYYENRSLAGQRMTDHEMAMSLFLQNAVDITAMDQDRELARLLAEELNLGEDDIDMPRHRPNVMQSVHFSWKVLVRIDICHPPTRPQNTQATTPNRATGNGLYVANIYRKTCVHE